MSKSFDLTDNIIDIKFFIKEKILSEVNSYNQLYSIWIEKLNKDSYGVVYALFLGKENYKEFKFKGDKSYTGFRIRSYVYKLNENRIQKIQYNFIESIPYEEKEVEINMERAKKYLIDNLKEEA